MAAHSEGLIARKGDGNKTVVQMVILNVTLSSQKNFLAISKN